MQWVYNRHHLGVFLLFCGLCLLLTSLTFADVKEEKHEAGEGEKEFEHLHFPTPWPYHGQTPPNALWTDPAVLARGKQLYDQACAVCHGVDGDGHGPASAGQRPALPNFTEAGEIAEMGPDFWLWIPRLNIPMSIRQTSTPRCSMRWRALVPRHEGPRRWVCSVLPQPFASATTPQLHAGTVQIPLYPHRATTRR